MTWGTRRTGTVFIDDFDDGIARSMGGVLIDVELDGEMAQEYVVSIPDVVGPKSHNGMVPIYFEAPDDSYSDGVTPSIIINCSFIPATNRWQPGGRAYRVVAPQSKMVASSYGTVGPTMVEQKPHALPYDFTYDIQLKAKKRRPAIRMFRHIGRKGMWMHGLIVVMDSEGYPRTYDAFQESVNNLSDIGEIGNREVGFSLSVRVAGELDFWEPKLYKTAYLMMFRAYTRAEMVRLFGV